MRTMDVIANVKWWTSAIQDLITARGWYLRSLFAAAAKILPYNL
jgi:hypothetical protein